jgi:chromosome partitioning protein
MTSHSMKVVATYAIKGGVGKTSAAVNLAHLAARAGLRTLVWDLDPQGSATFLFRVRPRVRGGSRAVVDRGRDLDAAIKGTDVEGLDLLPADFRYRALDLELNGLKKPRRVLRRRLDTLADQFDLTILDCPPSVSLATESVLDAADLLVVPITPSPLSIRSLDQLRAFLDDLSGIHRPDILAFLSLVDRRRASHRALAARLPQERKDVAPVVIPTLAAVERMAEELAPVAAFAPRSPAAAAYADLWRCVSARLGCA